MIRSVPDGRVGVREHGLAAGGLDRGRDGGLGAGDHDRPDRRLRRPPPHVHDHRLAGDRASGLSGSGGAQPRGDQHDRTRRLSSPSGIGRDAIFTLARSQALQGSPP